MSSRRHSACCCVRLDDWIYKCACGKSKWRCGSTIVITGKWLILGLLDVATIAISIALVVVRIFFRSDELQISPIQTRILYARDRRIQPLRIKKMMFILQRYLVLFLF